MFHKYTPYNPDTQTYEQMDVHMGSKSDFCYYGITSNNVSVLFYLISLDATSENDSLLDRIYLVRHSFIYVSMKSHFKSYLIRFGENKFHPR